MDLPTHGAVRLADGRVRFRVWAPACAQLRLVVWDAASVPGERPLGAAGCQRAVHLERDGQGYFSAVLSDLPDGTRYAYELPHGRVLPDPASRWQPDGLLGPSAVFTPRPSARASGFAGVALADAVFYELHVGTFTPQGTFEAAIPRLRDLAELGVTVIELLPCAQFPGTRNWGYDGAAPFAVQPSYGGPLGLQTFVEAAHQQGLGVVLDVVYNHVGPEGAVLGEFGPYFTDRYQTPWGRAWNFDGPDSDAVRSYVVDNALYWLDALQLDGLRLDAVHAIYDQSARHILTDLRAAASELASAQSRHVLLVAESNQNDPRLVRPADAGGLALDASWNDDLHHALHVLLTGERQARFADYVAADALAQVFARTYLLDGRPSAYRRRRVGADARDVPRERFVVGAQNHDQVGNRIAGERLAALASPAQLRLAAGLVLLSPFTPLLFMGEEYGETNPFPFFCSFAERRLNRAVRKGRRRMFAQQQPGVLRTAPREDAPETRDAAVLRWTWPAGSAAAALRSWYQALLRARKSWPALADRAALRVDRVAENPSDPGVLLLERGGRAGVLLVANLTAAPRGLPDAAQQRDVLLSSAETRFGGSPECDPAQLKPWEFRVCGPRRIVRRRLLGTAERSG